MFNSFISIEKNKENQQVKNAIYGVAVGDALGVPYEFKKRDTFKCTKMCGWGKYMQPKGTFSDDTSLTLALLDSMANFSKKPNLKKLSKNCIKWLMVGKFSINRYTFDVGFTTRRAILNMIAHVEPTKCGGYKERTKGNGSLMRILPLVFYLKDISNFEERKKWCFDVSSLTHRTLTCEIACHFYVEYALKLLKGAEKYFAYRATIMDFKDHYSSSELNDFKRIMDGNIFNLSRDEINSGGYVIDTLEASLWCFLKNKSYSECVFAAVNLGRDTDTTGAVCGGLAGIYYGFDKTSNVWINELRGKKLINKTINKFCLFI